MKVLNVRFPHFLLSYFVHFTAFGLREKNTIVPKSGLWAAYVLFRLICLEVSELLSIFADGIIFIKYDKDNKHFTKCA